MTKMKTRWLRIAVVFLAAAASQRPSLGWAFDTGVSDDRVSLPEGPGTLEGVGENVAVDPNMGMMSYSIPLAVPAGFPGVTPGLSFTYSSASGSSAIGMGWSMHWPSIERMTMRGVPQYNEGDLFVADGGNELVRVSARDLDADQPAIYRNRFEKNFARYLWHQRDDGARGYWEVQYADGRRGYFGANAAGTVVPNAIEAGSEGTFKYHLVEMVDVFDHRMRFDYIKESGISLLSAIGYVFTTQAPTYRVAFTYAPRPDLVFDGKAGFDRILRSRLTGAEVFVRGGRLRRVALTYEDNETTGNRSRLARLETFGASDGRYPVVHSFSYSRGLGAQCDSVDCGKPYLVTMAGDAGLGVTFSSGTANLVDINGDALPDLIDTSPNQRNHRFFINRLGSDGTHTFSEPIASTLGETAAFPLQSPLVQFIDVNGDGFTDLVNGGGNAQRVLINRGTGDWASIENLTANDPSIWTGTDAQLRFMDYDNDMRIDLIRSTANQSFVFENDGSLGFTRVDLQTAIGVPFDENIQFADMNGDGLLEIIQLQAGQLRYKTNYGRGRFGDWIVLGTPFGAGEFELALIEDLDSDGFADVLVVTGNTLKYVLNRNGAAFEPLRTLTEAGGVALPDRQASTTVLAADMNGNGSTDIVWVGETGSVRYLELFPVRSHLMNRIENGLGRVTEIFYQPSVEQRALAAEQGQPWVHPLPHPMTVVARTDEYDLLSNVHEVIDFRYRDGFYDGLERQFRGFAEVTESRPGDDSQATGRTLMRYSVGRSKPHLNGVLLFEQQLTADRIVEETTRTFGDDSECPVAEVPTNAELIALGRKPIGFACEVLQTKEIKDGAAPDQWVTTRSRMSYSDGYGNVDLLSEEGVVAVGGSGCAPCARPDGTFGEPCGEQCLGDERYQQNTYVPVSQTGGRWLINKVARSRTFGVAGNPGSHYAEAVFYYDGDRFRGLPVGQLTQGKLTRQTTRLSDDKVITVVRQHFDEHGNAIEVLDPLATEDGPSHRRAYTFDADGLRLTQADVFNVAPDGQPYSLRRVFQYDPLFDKVSLASKWMMVQGGTTVTAEDYTAYTQDEFGRLSSVIAPGGDTSASPTIEYTYELGSPSSRIITRRRSAVGGPADIETIACVDGRDRMYQTRKRVRAGHYTVDGFSIFNLQSQKIRGYQSYTSDSAVCDQSPPAGVASIAFRYDGVGRLIERIHPDDDVPGGASVSRTAYGPLRLISFDGEDNDPSSPHHDTPEIRTMDGLGRLVALQRNLAGDSAVTRVEYDALGFVAGYVDAAGHRKAQTHDPLGRVVSVVDPNAGTMRFEYDDASNVIRRTDARGVSVELRYDGLNREVERYDPARRDATIIATAWDSSPDCEVTRCPNTAGRVVYRSYPEGIDFFGYDVRRRGFSAVRIIEGQTYDMQTRYDNADRIVERVFPDGRSLAYTYDGASRLAGIPGVIDSVTYTPQGLAREWVRSSGVVDRFDYDRRLRLAGVSVEDSSNQMLQAIEVNRDRAGNVVRLSDAANAALLPPTVYTHDAWYRSTEVDRSTQTDAMTFDLIDNVVRMNGLNVAYP